MKVATKYQMLIDGQWVDSSSGKTFESINPGTREVNGVVPQGEAEDVDRAVQAARKAFESGPWADMAPSDRGRLLFKVAQKMWANLEVLAEIESKENGQPINETKFIVIPHIIDVLEFYAGLANKVQGETLAAAPNRFSYTLREPLGVVGAIVPWNFPMLLTMWKLAPALAAGNTVVIKPPKEASIGVLELVKIFQEAGVPDGVINVVTGSGATVGQAIASHPGIDKVAFTGSTATGRMIMQAASQNVTPVSLELGGKSPNIIFEDVNLEDAVNVCAFGIYFNKGEVCIAGSRILVQDSIYDKFMDLFVKRAQSIRVGYQLDPSTQMGPQISEAQLQRIESYVQKGSEEGAELVTGGKRLDHPTGGYYYMPTVFGNVSTTMTIAQEEIFGPVASVIRFKDEEEALKIANDTMYGLCAGIWTNDIKRAHRMAKNIKSGTVFINTYGVLDSNGPFGGMKQSGFGRELGVQAMDMYTQIKHVWVDLSPQALNWYGQ